MRIDLNGRRVLVTGGNSGLGAAMVRAFGAAGAKVGINYVAHPEDADALVDALKQDGGHQSRYQRAGRRRRHVR
jgi:NAD(P)-dependent dehydrogenase (short-subunit alcohol dehydrogenase family)